MFFIDFWFCFTLNTKFQIGPVKSKKNAAKSTKDYNNNNNKEHLAKSVTKTVKIFVCPNVKFILTNIFI